MTGSACLFCGCEEWEPIGSLGPYLVEGCCGCETAAILPTEGEAPPMDLMRQVLDFQCIGTRSDGQPCHAPAVSGQDYCRHHISQAQVSA
jgi:hypothetical protein